MSEENQNKNTPEPAKVSVSLPIKQGGGLHKYLNFETMVTKSIVKWIYIVLAVILLIATLVAMFTAGSFWGFLLALFGGALSQVFLRILCEMYILFFVMHEELVSIRKNTTK